MKILNKRVSFLVLFSLIFIILLFGVDLKTGMMSDAAGEWTVGIINLEEDEDEFDVFGLLGERDFLKIPNNSAVTGDSMYFLADPFLFRNQDTTYLFVEAQPFGKSGAYICAYRISDDLQDFKYLGIALKEDFHLSYPHVLKVQNEIFMIPESQGGDSSFVYRSVNFPLEWEKFSFLLPERIKDPTLVPTDDSNGSLFYTRKGLLLSRNYEFKNNKFHLGDELYIKTGTAFRPGGSPFNLNGSVFLPIQDNSNGYGTNLMAIEIFNGEVQSSKTNYLLKPHKEIYEFSAGMHHMSSIEIDGKKTVAIDGRFLVSDNSGFNIKFFIKYNYLNIWDHFFGSKLEPWYPFGE